MKKVGVTILIASVIYYLYFYVIPVDHGKFVGSWFAIGDSESANTVWDISRLNIIDPDIFWFNEDEYGKRLYYFSKENSYYQSKDFLYKNRNIDFKGKLEYDSKDTLKFSNQSDNKNAIIDLILIRLNNQTQIDEDINLDENYLLNGYWVFEQDSIIFEMHFTKDHLFDDIEGHKIVKVLSYNKWEIEEPYSVWSFKFFNGKPILTIGLRDYFMTSNFIFNEVTKNSISATHFMDTYQNEVVLQKKNTNESEKHRVSNILTSRTWELKEADQLPQSSHISGGYPPIDYPNYHLTQDEINDKELSFKFNQDSTFQIFKTDSLLIESNWWLSNNHQLLFSDMRFNNFIKILETSSDRIILEMYTMVWGEDDVVIDKFQDFEKVEMEMESTFQQLKYRFVLE